MSQIHWNPGIPIAAGTVTLQGSQNEYTFSGYIPVTPGSGAVPAVSSWGVAIMALLIVAAGGVAFRRRVQIQT